MDIYTKSRDNLYQATAHYIDGEVIVKKGSQINLKNKPGYKPSKEIKRLRDDNNIVSKTGALLIDVKFRTLSAAATFVTGRVANGLIVWKTIDGKCVRRSMKTE